jgi:hypothetical protein
MKVVHCKKEPYDVYVGRPTKWGNPFILGQDGDREEVVRKYRRWIFTQNRLLEEARKDLAGKVLACWCAPLACHADILSDIANRKVYAACGMCDGYGWTNDKICHVCSGTGYSGT